jgi:hypothetical protein
LRKNIFFLRLDWRTFLPIVLYRIIGYRAWFFDASEYFKDAARIERYAKWDVLWLNHHDHGLLFSAGEFERNLRIQSDKIVLHLCGLESFGRLSEIMQSQDLEAVLFQKVFAKIFKPLELIYLSRAAVPGQEPIYLWFPNTLITRRLLDSYTDVKNKCPRVVASLDWALLLLGRVARVMASGVRNLIRSLFSRSPKQPAKDAVSDAPGRRMAAEDASVIYFPHQGIFYGNLFAKDHFYSASEHSPFWPAKILHVELDDSVSLNQRTTKYYRDRHITNINWSSLRLNKSNLLKAEFEFGIDCARSMFRGFDFDLLITYLSLVWSTQQALQRIKGMKSLRIVLVGYDILFPQSIALACRLANVKTIAVQERMLASWIMGPLLLDYYFVMGASVGQYLRAHAPPQCRVEEIGPIRLKDHRLAQVPKFIDEVRKSYDFVVLALDYHSESHWFSGKNAIANNWRNNMLFCDHVIELCRRFPKAYFLLKGKNTNFVKIDYFKDKVAQMRAQQNLLLLEDQDVWTPFTSVAAADIAVARHTSLADEMLALGKPVIFDDFDGFPSKISDYGRQFTALNFAQLQDKLNQFFSDPTGYTKMIKSICSNLYCAPDFPVDKVLQKRLHEIYAEL